MLANKEMWTGNDFGKEGTRMISEALRINSSLTELDLNSDKKEKWIRKRNMKNEMNRQYYWSRRSKNDKWRIKE